MKIHPAGNTKKLLSISVVTVCGGAAIVFWLMSQFIGGKEAKKGGGDASKRVEGKRPVVEQSVSRSAPSLFSSDEFSDKFSGGAVVVSGEAEKKIERVRPEDVIRPYERPTVDQLAVLAEVQELMPGTRIANEADWQSSRDMITNATPTNPNSPAMRDILEPQSLSPEEREQILKEVEGVELPEGDYFMTEEGLEYSGE